MTALITLPAELTIYSVGELHPAWSNSLAAATTAVDGAAGESFAVDAAAVAEIDAAGLQLLLSLANALARSDRVLRLLNPSQTLRQACAALGLTPWLLPALPAGVKP
jgi:anti-anti-sigma regulatory factor